MTDLRDIIARLRQLGSGVAGTISDAHLPLLNEAADAIEAMLGVCHMLEDARRAADNAYGCVTSEGSRQRLRQKFPWLDTTLTPREPNE